MKKHHETPGQLGLPMRTKRPDVNPAEIDAVCAVLRAAGWVTSADICRRLDITDRRLRAVAEHSDGRIVSGPGSPGYALNDGTLPPAEVLRTADAHTSQGSRHFHRARAILARAHRHLAAHPTPAAALA